ncbi:outer membrane porin, OprD family [Pantoea sp. KPR_PJ]
MIPLLLSLQPAQAKTVNASRPWKDNPFLDDTHVDLRLRNHWKYLKENEAQPKAVHNAWGQSATLNFRSGYLWQVFGFDASYTRAIRLGASDYFASRGLLYDAGGNRKRADAHGFSKFGQRYLKIKLDENDLKLQAKAGWQELKDFGVLTTTNRLSRNSYLGYSATLSGQALRLDAAYITRGIRHDSPKSQPLQTSNKQTIPAVLTGGLTWPGSQAQLAYSYGEARHYQRRHVIEGRYAFSPHWRFSSQIYGSEALDNYKSMPASKREFDKRAWHYVGELQWQQESLTQKVAVAWTSAAKHNATGYYARPITKNTRGRFNSLTSAGKDYTRNRELALVSLTEYEMRKGVFTGLQINYGQFNYRNNSVRTGEIGWINHLHAPHPSLNNLSVFTLLSYGWSYKNNKETPLLNAQGKYMRSPCLAAEIGIEYNFNLFN